MIEILDEIAACAPLKQIDIDRFLALGTPSLALARNRDGYHSPVRRASIVTVAPGRFEFERYWQGSEEAKPAFVVPAHGPVNELTDIIAWRPGLLAGWLGTAAILGEEQLHGPPLAPAIVVHRDMISWFASGREGVVVVDDKRAADALEGFPVVAESVEHGRYLRKILTQPAPRIGVRIREAA